MAEAHGLSKKAVSLLIEWGEKILAEQVERLARSEIDVEFFTRQSLTMLHGEERKKTLMSIASNEKSVKDLRVLIRSIESKLDEWRGLEKGLSN